MAAADVTRLEIEKADDRDAVVQILARNGYTVRQVKEKVGKNTRSSMSYQSISVFPR